MADRWTGFRTAGVNADGKPKWLTYPCQMRGADSTDRCMIPINGQRNGNGATWTCDGADKAAQMPSPNVNPSIRCGENVCHFHIRHGKFEYCGDHKGRRDG